MGHEEWKLTCKEMSEVVRCGGNLYKAEEAKRKAYIEAGGVILNPDALEDLYEACKMALWALEGGKVYVGDVDCGTEWVEDSARPDAIAKAQKAIAKVEGK